jgi:hypothetical protein
MWFRLALAAALTSLAIAGCGGERAAHGGDRSGGGGVAAAMRDRAQIRDVLRRFRAASLAGDSGAMCALVDPAKLRYLELIGQPCEVFLSGTLTADSERDVRGRMITSVEIAGDKAVAHTRGASGARDLELQRSEGHWLIVGV